MTDRGPCQTCGHSETAHHLESGRTTCFGLADQAFCHCAAYLPPAVETGEDDDQIYRCLAAAWFYGGWKAETINEQSMRSVMERRGWWPFENEAALLAKLSPPSPLFEEGAALEYLKYLCAKAPVSPPPALPEGWFEGYKRSVVSPESDSAVERTVFLIGDEIEFRATFTKSGSMIRHRLPLAVLDYLRHLSTTCQESPNPSGVSRKETP